jgi:hypothetical protein
MRPELVELMLECRRLRKENIRLRKELVEARSDPNDTAAKMVSPVCENTSLAASANDILNRQRNDIARGRSKTVIARTLRRAEIH